MSGEAVKVIVRCRPINKRELDLDSKIVVNMTQGVTCHLTNPDEPDTTPKFFTFDGAYHIDSTTEQIYNDVGFALVESVLEGYNGTVFAYGQTGCGKSFTMQGIPDPPAQRGIIPRSFEHIFEVIQTSEDMKYLVHASYLEIYNEEIRDLLGSDTKKKLDLKEHPDKGVYVSNLTQHPVHNTSECESLMEKGWSSRSVGSTLMNAESSRSHSIFTIALEMMSTAGDSDSIRSGKLNLVDLAGSERQAKTGATGDRLKEATKINLSLSALGNVISALVDGKSKHIPYRDSKLTRLLQDSLGGNTKTLMIACLSPADNNYDETLSTLRYANRAKNIKNKPKVNEDPKDAMLREYQEEIRKLKEMLDKQGPLETGMSLRGGHQVISVAPDEAALEQEREKVRREYEMKMQKMKKDVEAERESKAVLQANMEKLKKKYEQELEVVNKKIQEKHLLEQQRQKSALIQNANKQTIGIETVTQDGTIVYEDVDDDNVSTTATTVGVVKMQNAGMMTSMQEEALKRLKELQNQMVGGEKVQDKELKAKRMKRKKYLEKRKKILSDALKNVDDEDGIMLKVYDDIHEELKAKTELAKKQKQKMKNMEAEIQDLSEEFQNERSDYLETIRKQDQQVKLLQAVLERVKPTIRKDCNYSDLDSIKKEAVWDDEYQRWKVPDLTVQKTKLPPTGPASTQAQSELLTKFNKINEGSLNKSFNNNYQEFVSDRLQMAARNPSQTAPARLGMWDDEEDDNVLKQKLQRGAQEDIAGSYFKPKRAKELLVKFKGHAASLPAERSKKFSSSNNLNMSMSQNYPLNLNTSINNTYGASQGTSHNLSWGPSSSTNLLPQTNMTSTYGGSGPSLNTLGNVMSNGWLDFAGDNGYSPSSTSPESTLRRPNRLMALPTIGGQTNSKKKSRDVLHTLDLI